MKAIHLTVAAALAAGLAACGGGNPASAPNGSAAGPGASAGKAAPRAANASAEEVANESRGDVHCPARIETRPRDPRIDGRSPVTWGLAAMPVPFCVWRAAQNDAGQPKIQGRFRLASTIPQARSYRMTRGATSAFVPSSWMFVAVGQQKPSAARSR